MHLLLSDTATNATSDVNCEELFSVEGMDKLFEKNCGVFLLDKDCSSFFVFLNFEN